jgi:LysM repeat protein
MQKTLILLLTLGLLGACTSVGEFTPTIENPSPSPRLVKTSTPSPITMTSTVLPSETNIQSTSTPFLYTVELNDTLTAIAIKFNISLEELVAANPSVGSQALTVGLVLVIPTPLNIDSEPTSTPLPVTIQQTQCYQNQDDSLWCLSLLKNEFSDVIQNLSIRFSLLDSNRLVVKDQTAYAPMDILAPGKSIVLGTIFKSPIPDGFSIQAQIISASRLPAVNLHYLEVNFQNYLVQVDWEGKNAEVSGQIMLANQSNPANRIWILAMAYDGSDKIIGFRRWESNETLAPNESLSFNFEVSSLGPDIDHVEILVEAAN